MPPFPKPKPKTFPRFAPMIERFLLLWLTLLSLLAYFWVDLFPALVDPFDLSKQYLNVLIAATMFAIGSLLPRDDDLDLPSHILLQPLINIGNINPF